MKKRIIFPTIIIGILIVAYSLGPHPVHPAYNTDLPDVPETPVALENYLSKKETSLPVKPDNQARIVWANDSLKDVTNYVIIYLHGFGASCEEGDPVHMAVAKKFGSNLLLTRLSGHGLNESKPLLNFTADRLWKSALEYYAIGKKLGKKVILMGTSTGGTLALKLAAEFPDIAAIILYSPNIEVNNGKAWILNNPWGLQIARKLNGGDELIAHHRPSFYKKYWYDHYRLEGAVQMEELVETSMVRATFRRVKQPVLMLYYYKDEQHQDEVAKVSAMLKMFDQLGTPSEKKVKSAIPEAGDHVICSLLRSKDIVSVERYTEEFLKNIVF